jgi:hypothetical protein
MAGLSAELERTFVRLWTHCDDAGRAIDNPRLIKAALFPLHDDVTTDGIDGHLAALVAAGLIVRYQEGDRRYLAVCSWGEFQKPQRPTPSKFPEPSTLPGDDSRKARGTIADASSTPPLRSGVEIGVGEGVEALSNEDFEPNELSRRWAVDKGLGDAIGVETAKFLEWHRARGSEFADWNAAWRTWMLRTKPSTANDADAKEVRPHPPELSRCVGCGELTFNCRCHAAPPPVRVMEGSG